MQLHFALALHITSCILASPFSANINFIISAKWVFVATSEHRLGRWCELIYFSPTHHPSRVRMQKYSFAGVSRVGSEKGS
jgi:hypothetical protein